MKILGIDSSTQVASVAVVEEDRILGEYYYNMKKSHSEKLMPMIRSLLELLDISLRELSGVAVALGPGSFTGLRIGLATAKGLAYAVDRPLVGINTLDGLAYNVHGIGGGCCPMINARRGESYTALYASNGQRLSGYQALDVQSLKVLMEENELENPVFLGDGALACMDELSRAFPSYRLAEPGVRLNRGSSVALLAMNSFREHKYDNIYTLEPFYIRESGAERIRKQAMAEGAGR